MKGTHGRSRELSVDALVGQNDVAECPLGQSPNPLFVISCGSKELCSVTGSQSKNRCFSTSVSLRVDAAHGVCKIFLVQNQHSNLFFVWQGLRQTYQSHGGIVLFNQRKLQVGSFGTQKESRHNCHNNS